MPIIAKVLKCQKCLKSLIEKNDLGKVSGIHETKEFQHKQRESRYTIKGALILKYVKIDQRFSTYLIAFVELYIQMYKCNSLMNKCDHQCSQNDQNSY